MANKFDQLVDWILQETGVSPSSGPTPTVPPIPIRDPKNPHHKTQPVPPVKSVNKNKKKEYPAKEQGYPRNETGLEQ